MFALSTSWNNAFNRSGRQVVEEIKKLGFDSVELAFSHTNAQLVQIKKVKDLRVVSLHNYCPVPEAIPYAKALPDCYNLATPNSTERKAAVSFAKRTIRFAKKFNARVVILHCGRVQMHDYTKKLFRIKNKGIRNGEFERLKQQTVKEREKKKNIFLDHLFLSMQELAGYAHNEGIRIGIENRIYLREIPNFSEIKILLEAFSNKGVGYWHDTGHAYLLDKLGFSAHTDYLKAYQRLLIGVHFHDVSGFQDHRAPFSGEINFSALKPYIKKNTLKVIEAHRPTRAQAIVAARKELEHLFAS